jgi:hypothetical protein
MATPNLRNRKTAQAIDWALGFSISDKRRTKSREQLERLQGELQQALKEEGE